jgi:Tfp pilus assembly protein FimT
MNVRLNLVDLLVAMTITALLVLSLLPLATVTYRTMAVEQGAEELARELQAARQLAVASNYTYDVVFDSIAQAYYVKPGDMHAPGRRIQLPPGVEWVTFPQQRISFYQSGRCNLGCTITLGHRDSDYRVKVILATHSGRVRVERGSTNGP